MPTVANFGGSRQKDQDIAGLFRHGPANGGGGLGGDGSAAGNASLVKSGWAAGACAPSARGRSVFNAHRMAESGRLYHRGLIKQGA